MKHVTCYGLWYINGVIILFKYANAVYSIYFSYKTLNIYVIIGYYN